MKRLGCLGSPAVEGVRVPGQLQGVHTAIKELERRPAGDHSPILAGLEPYRALPSSPGYGEIDLKRYDSLGYRRR